MQWLDDLDDLVAAIGLIGERIRSLLIALSLLAVSLSLPAAGVLLALAHPPLALASATMLLVMMLYRTVTAAPLPLRHTA